ncbi:heme-degrading domain-containing protein [Granulicella sp. WH15]|uniref:heme-degrading domain-containing protein n=1 Tax=Granulicella sp. WH15 TaxID=2602070 RepID=UPI0013670EBF|nr:heme-degrading domain-containing protein [Granulicella sp. WH15]QHN03452.1 heme-degrading domain-containing protein [Granulicella sp. WH15]
MGLAEDIERMKVQEAKLQFAEFGAETAWTIGSKLRDRSIALGAGMTFEIQVAGRMLFAVAMNGAAQGQEDWIRRKRNTVMRFGRSSYHVGRQLVLDGTTLEERQGLKLADYAAHGGGFPVVLRGTGLVGTVVASGLPQRDDHEMVVAVLAEVLGVTGVALD